MSLQAEIKTALAAHSMWKGRLNAAIDTGASEFAPEKVQTDNQCAFGKWLYGPNMPAADKIDGHYEAVRHGHAAFHKAAADVLRLALVGKKAEAHQLIQPGGRFAELSAHLTACMIEWSKTIK